MTSKEFISKELNKLVKQIPNVKCSYKFDEFCSFHNIEIVPKSVFENSAEIIRIQFDIISTFHKRFSDEQLVFFTEEDLIEMENPDFVIYGKEFGTKIDEKLSWMDFLSGMEKTISQGINGVTGKVEHKNNYALAA